jgi:UDPglucose 6-dehydrogenase
MIQRNVSKNRLFFTTSLTESLLDADAVFIAVGTPPDEDGSADLSYVLEVAAGIGRQMDRYMVIVTKSTVPIGTAAKVEAAVRKELLARNIDIEFDVASNPNLKEGSPSDFPETDGSSVDLVRSELKKL